MSRRTGTGHHHTRLAPHARRGPVQAKQKWPGRGKAQTLPAATDETVRTSRGKTGGALAEPGEPLHGGASLWRRRQPVLLLEPLSRPPGARRGQSAALGLSSNVGERWEDGSTRSAARESGTPRFSDGRRQAWSGLRAVLTTSLHGKMREWVERKQRNQAAKSRRRSRSSGWSNHVPGFFVLRRQSLRDDPICGFTVSPCVIRTQEVRGRKEGSWRPSASALLR